MLAQNNLKYPRDEMHFNPKAPNDTYLTGFQAVC